jgi:hypothetical protein
MSPRAAPSAPDRKMGAREATPGSLLCSPTCPGPRDMSGLPGSLPETAVLRLEERWRKAKNVKWPQVGLPHFTPGEALTMRRGTVAVRTRGRPLQGQRVGVVSVPHRSKRAMRPHWAARKTATKAQVGGESRALLSWLLRWWRLQGAVVRLLCTHRQGQVPLTGPRDLPAEGGRIGEVPGDAQETE